MNDHTHGTFGRYLRSERELRGISLDEIAGATKIKLEYLRAIEQDSFHLLPNQTFIKGYLRAYSKYCGMNEDEVLVNYEFYEQQKGEKAAEPSIAEPEHAPVRENRWLVYLILLLATVVVSFGFAYFLGGFRNP